MYFYIYNVLLDHVKLYKHINFSTYIVLHNIK
jgi:hypothetical protein